MKKCYNNFCFLDKISTNWGRTTSHDLKNFTSFFYKVVKFRPLGGRSKIFFSSFEMKSCIKNHVVVLKKLYQTKIIDFHYLFSNPPKIRQFGLLAVPVTLLSIMSARQLISKIWETLTRVSDPSTRCKNFKFNGWELWIFRGG